MKKWLPFHFPTARYVWRYSAAILTLFLWRPLLIIIMINGPLIPPASALPIGYGYNQGDLKFRELSSANFTVYHDSRAPEDAKLAMRSLEAARTNVERWFGVTRTSPLIVNMSANSDNPSFANFVTDSIELQTLGQGGRDLAWHEYTHSTMYRHIDNWFGPAGALIHLPWMEAWFLEGLAEAVSVSVGSDEQAGIERYQALTNHWPTWDRLHSLYSNSAFNFRGYATSGAFVAWILQTYDAAKLPDMLESFRAYSMPWYWPWAITPFNGFLPMDSSLKTLTGKGGEELYTQYKIDATAHWKSVVTAPVLSAKIAPDEATSSAWAWQFSGKRISKTSPPHDAASVQVATSVNATAWISSYYPKANHLSYKIALEDGQRKTKWLPRASTWIDGPWLTPTHVWWLETHIETARLCSATRKTFDKSSVHCKLAATMPVHLRHLGQRDDSKTQTTATIWLARDNETLKGDVHQVLEVDLSSSQIKTLSSPVGGRPISVATTPEGTWMLAADRSQRYVVKLDANFQCSGMVDIADHPVRILASDSTLPNVVIFTTDGYVARSLDTEKFPVKACHALSERSSPLLAAMRSSTPLTFPEALKSSSIWSLADNSSNALASGQASKSIEAPQAAPEHGSANPAATITTGTASETPSETKSGAEPTSRTAAWRGRPIFGFPWIATDDPMGPQIGIISVPLMDQMQNETVRATLLVGTVSRFPYQDVTLTSNRFKPTWSLSGFRAQAYNGRYRTRASGPLLSKYLEESGAHVDATLNQYWKYLSFDWSWGMKSSHLKPYIGPARRSGHLNETYAGIRASVNNGGRLFASTSLQGTLVPAAMNHDFNYDGVKADITTGTRMGKGRFELGLDAGRTRGPKRRDLQEMYSPLKTMIPGSGAGLNQASFPLSTDQGLFTPVFGENQARARILATHPLVENIDKFKGLIYIDQLNVSGFFNYGTAWRGTEMPKKKSFIAAQGYNLDLFMDNKGVRFNFGLGAGQVLSKPWQGYWTFGFDALF
jgi:hypothetical protein